MKLILILSLFSLLVTGCEKCITCKAYDNDTNNFIFGREICGKKIYRNLEVAGFKNGWENDSTHAVCTND